MVYAMKRKGKTKLVSLYLAYHLNKSFIIVISVILISLLVIFLINLGLPINQLDYFENKNYMHVNYLEQSIYILYILNSVIVSSLIGNEISSISLYDPMFVSNIKRSKIINSKIVTNMIIITIIVCFETLFLLFIGVFFYPDFIVCLNDYKIIFFLLLYFFELLLIGEIFALIINNYFVTILIFSVSFIFNLMSEIENTKMYIYKIIPFINVSSIKNYTLSGDFFIYILVNIVLFMLIQVIYQKKDIK